MLPGEASVYFAGSYAGKILLDPRVTEEKLAISLGVDPAVQIERKQINSKKDKSFFGNTIKVNKSYAINLRNQKEKNSDTIKIGRSDSYFSKCRN